MERTTRPEASRPTERHSRRTLLQLFGALGAAAASVSLDTDLASPAAADDVLPWIPPATEAVTPFSLHVPDSALRDLRTRLAMTRWPDREPVTDWSQGVPTDRIRALAAHWQKHYDWRRTEARLNSLGQYRTEIDGLGIHFLHVRSPHNDAMPLILTHGWPGSVIEFLKVIDPLTDPTAHGGKSEDAFHVVVPSIPGYGFSDSPTETGWNTQRTAKAWIELMARLGYDRYAAQGGDMGSGVSTWMGKIRPPQLLGIHTNFPILLFDPPLAGDPDAEEQQALGQLNAFYGEGFGYFKEQATRPQTIGYALTDSPVGQAAWIYEKFGAWTDSDQNPESVLTYDEMLDDIMLYWLPGKATSSARMYWEEAVVGSARVELDLPVGVTVFPGEIARTPRIWAERTYHDLIYFNEAARGGHFAAFEQPRIFVEELRACFRLLR